MKIIHHVFDIDAPTDTVWGALTTRDGLASWWSTTVTAPPAAVGAEIHFTFAETFNPVMRVTTLEDKHELTWLCVGGHDPWRDNTFRFLLAELEAGRTRMRFWQDYATELADDDYGVYNFNWGYYLESLRLYCGTGTGKPFPARIEAQTYR